PLADDQWTTSTVIPLRTSYISLVVTDLRPRSRLVNYWSESPNDANSWRRHLSAKSENLAHHHERFVAKSHHDFPTAQYLDAA
ncbi:hypothetical protein, partial [Mycobacterium tuberculosis]|uniref:hypothetical protein n=1 Tax=Mycobacterium tuberculosis TaxID=1773 RepID=UPI00254CC33E